MALSEGMRIGPYSVVATLGAGGMGEVYRAMDTRLGRAAAIKTLPPEFAQDQDRRLRFEREARTLAALNHPHIAQIYGLEEVPATAAGPPALALAMELVEGEDLAALLARGPMAPDEVWPLVRQIAEGLEAAHEAGIVHRDLKPANIRVTPDGMAKVLDFGLAKPMDLTGDRAEATRSPTLTSPALTTHGVILGTASYMAPEQARGRPVDRRADIWAFGCVVYELLTGTRAFEGEDVTEILGAIIKTEPDWSRLPDAVPARVTTVLRRCLAKDRTERWQHIGDVRLALAEALAEPAPTPQLADGSRWLARIGWIAAGVATAVAAALAFVMTRPVPDSPARVTRFAIPLPSDVAFTNLGRHVLTLAPDGTTLVFVANLRLYRRDLASDDIQPIPGTQTRSSVIEPVFSPDGEWVAYYSTDERVIKRIRLDGTSAQAACPPSDTPSFGMSWGSTGLLIGDRDQGIVRCNPEDATSQVIVAVTSPQVAASPHEIPGTPWIAFSLAEGDSFDRWERGSIVVHNEATGERRTLVPSATDSAIAGRSLLYRSRSTLYTVPLELASNGPSITGPPVALIEDLRIPVGPDTNPPTGQYAATSTGILAYIRGNSVDDGRRVLAVADGTDSIKPLAVPPGDYAAPRVSPDGRLVAYSTGAIGQSVVWIHEIAASSPPRRLTFEGDSRNPIWSADGNAVYFTGRRDRRGIYRQRADGSTPAELVFAFDAAMVPEVALPDGSAVLVSEGGQGGRYTLGALSTRDGTVRRFDAIESTAPLGASISRDGRWLAYTVTRGLGPGTTTFVEPFPPTGAKYELPHQREAVHAVWMPNGRSLLYQDFSALLEIDVIAGASVHLGTPRAVQRGVIVAGPASARRNLDVIPGAETFLVVVPADLRSAVSAGDERQVDVIINWQELVRQRAPES